MKNLQFWQNFQKSSFYLNFQKSSILTNFSKIFNFYKNLKIVNFTKFSKIFSFDRTFKNLQFGPKFKKSSSLIKFSNLSKFVASNIFNLTLEFNEKHFDSPIFSFLQTNKTVGNFLGKVTNSGNSYMPIMNCIDVNK